MIQYNTLNVNLYNSQLNKLKSGIKNIMNKGLNVLDLMNPAEVVYKNFPDFKKVFETGITLKSNETKDIIKLTK